jgi:hypothetical protein
LAAPLAAPELAGKSTAFVAAFDVAHAIRLLIKSVTTNDQGVAIRPVKIMQKHSIVVEPSVSNLTIRGWALGAAGGAAF